MLKSGTEISIGEPVKMVERIVDYKAPVPLYTELVADVLRGFTDPPKMIIPEFPDLVNYGRLIVGDMCMISNDK